MKLIGISGKIGAGKDTLANFLVRYAEHSNPELFPTAVGFADLMKEYVAAHFGADRAKLFGTQEDKMTPLECNPSLTYRDAILLMGKFYNTVDPRYWTRKLFESLDVLQTYTNREVAAFIYDVRRPSECDEILSRGGIVLRLTACRNATDEQRAAWIENALDDYPHFTKVIDNRGIEPMETAAIAVHACTTTGILRKI